MNTNPPPTSVPSRYVPTTKRFFLTPLLRRPDTLIPSPARDSQRYHATRITNEWSWPVVLGTPWILVWWHLSAYWGIDPKYEFGWTVPLLSSYLFVANLRRGSLEGGRGSLPWARMLLLGIGFTAIWWLREANPEWSVMSLCLFSITTAYSVLGVNCLFGAGSWTLLLGPLALNLCAVPWPERLDVLATQGAMRLVAAVTGELMMLIGIPALASANVVLLPGAAVGIDDACSGVRSIQAVTMAALFLGSLRDLRWAYRPLLVVVGWLVTLSFNLVRCGLMVFIAARAGPAAFAAWHDPAGWTIFGGALLTLVVLSGRLPRRDRAVECKSPVRGWPSTALGVACIGWILGTLLLTGFWYRAGKDGWQEPIRVKWPMTAAGFVRTTPPAEAERVLHANTAMIGTWRVQDKTWSLFLANWQPGRTSPQSARLHRPETCFQASGSVLEAEFTPLILTVDSSPVPFRVYRFRRGSEPLYLYYHLEDGANADLTPGYLQDYSPLSRVQRAIARTRNAGQQVLEFMLAGYPSDSAAMSAFLTLAPNCLEVHLKLSVKNPGIIERQRLEELQGRELSRTGSNG
ncbi:MAG TPA: exosortase/archaeosortase family protein [Chthoniobacterales bacterium]